MKRPSLAKFKSNLAALLSKRSGGERSRKRGKFVRYMAVRAGDRVDWYRLNGQSLVPCEAPSGQKSDDHREVWRISPHDVLARSLDKRPRSKDLYNLGLNLLHETPAWLGFHGWYAFTGKIYSSVAEFKVRPFGLTILEKIAEDDVVPPSILRVSLTDSLVALATYRKDRSISGWMLAGVDDVDTVSESLAQEAGFADAPRLDLGSAGELLAGAPAVRPYPIEPEWRGVPTRTWQRWAIGASGALALMSCAHTFLGLRSVGLAQSMAHSAQLNLQHVQTLVTDWNRSHVDVIAHAHQIDVDALIAAVRSVHVPGSVATVQNNGFQIVVHLPLRNFGQLASGSWTSRKAFEDGFARKPPQGWTFTGVLRGQNGQLSLAYAKNGGLRR